MNSPETAIFGNFHRIELLLDNLRSILNVGSIFRTADGSGVGHIFCCGTTPTPDHPKIAKSGLGAENFIPWSYHRNAMDVINNLRQDHIICSIEATQKSLPLFENFQKISFNKNMLLVIGNEISGIDPQILNLSDHVFSLPMVGSKNSLNVAVATGIALYTFQFRK
ncbi:MAG: RNA methyltransferase [Chloroflexi bacterium]|nr:RNA methyltransferase [Chloroflexota bacterium]